jgi:hypothetical protein
MSSIAHMISSRFFLLVLPLIAFGCGSKLAAEAGNQANNGRRMSLCDLPPSVPMVPPSGATVDYVACDIVRSVVDEATAQSLGLPLQRDLGLLNQPVNVPFHRGDSACTTTPSTDGKLAMVIHLDAIEVAHLQPGNHAPPGYQCPTDFLVYQTTVNLTSDDGSIVGVFNAEFASGETELDCIATPDVRGFHGTLGIRADLTRRHRGTVGVTMTLKTNDASGQLFTSVDYGDGMNDQGDGEFWPPNIGGHCGWLKLPTPPKSPMMTLDDYDAACGS